MLLNEITLCVCQYLSGADVLYAFYNFVIRLNSAITDYCHSVNLMSISYKQFNYATTHILPSVGCHIRSIVVNANWKTLILAQLFSNLFTSRLSFLCPQLQKLKLTGFSINTILLLIDGLENVQ